MNRFGHVFIFIILGCVVAHAQLREELHQSFKADTTRPMEVVVQMDAGEILISGSDKPDVCDLSLLFPSDEYWNDIDFNESKNRLHIKIDKERWFRFNNSDDDDYATFELQLPKNALLLLTVRLKAGELRMDLGGLKMEELNVSSWAGETRVDFDTPNQIAMEMMDISAKIGECRLEQLGNARFKRARIDGGIGELSVDFSGEVYPEGRAKVDLDIGEASVYLPEDKNVQLFIGGTFSFMSAKEIDSSLRHRGRYYYSRDFDETQDPFFVKITPGLGELRVECR